MVDVPTEIRNGNFPNTSQEIYRLSEIAAMLLRGNLFVVAEASNLKCLWMRIHYGNYIITGENRKRAVIKRLDFRTEVCLWACKEAFKIVNIMEVTKRRAWGQYRNVTYIKCTSGNVRIRHNLDVTRQLLRRTLANEEIKWEWRNFNLNCYLSIKENLNLCTLKYCMLVSSIS
jgi:hypothetical protein